MHLLLDPEANAIRSKWWKLSPWFCIPEIRLAEILGTVSSGYTGVDVDVLKHMAIVSAQTLEHTLK